MIRYPSFDGRLIPAFVKYPGPEFPGPHPVLIVIHGGPNAQYRPRYSLLENILTSEFGITLIMPNVRGSTGYGQHYTDLDNGRQREDAVRDIGSLLDWIATQPNLDVTRVAVSGGSYGGYMALASLMYYGERLLAGIDIAGVSNFETFLRGARATSVEGWRKEFGDERDPEMVQFLRSISPQSHADRIRKPLLVIHGENDPRVKVTQSDQIVAAVRRNGHPVWYVRIGQEGHVLESVENNSFCRCVQILFLERYLLKKH